MFLFIINLVILGFINAQTLSLLQKMFLPSCSPHQLIFEQSSKCHEACENILQCPSKVRRVCVGGFIPTKIKLIEGLATTLKHLYTTPQLDWNVQSSKVGGLDLHAQEL